MQQKNIAFTLIEIIVVISIIIIISSSWTYYFFWFLDNQRLISRVGNVFDEIEALDNKVKNKNIYDYELHFSELGFYFYLNNYDTHYNQYLNMDFNSWTWIISTNSITPWLSRTLIIYKWVKKSFSTVIDSMDSYTWLFSDSPKYKILWNIWWSTTNEIWIKYYHKRDLNDKESTFYLENIYENINMTSSCDLNDFKIINVWWKKEFICWTTKLTNAYLLFTDWNKSKLFELN